MYYQVFIDEAYVRDGQAFLEGKVDKTLTVCQNQRMGGLT